MHTLYFFFCKNRKESADVKIRGSEQGVILIEEVPVYGILHVIDLKARVSPGDRILLITGL
jgi:hypothetical protein